MKCVRLRIKRECGPTNNLRSGFYGARYVFSPRVTFNWSVRSISRTVDITATKQPHQSDGAKTNPVSIYGLFTHFLFSHPHSSDSPIIAPSLVPPLSHLLYLRAHLLKTAMSFFPLLVPLPLSPPSLPTDCPAPISRPLCLPTCLPVLPPSLISLSSHLHPSVFSPQTTLPFSLLWRIAFFPLVFLLLKSHWPHFEVKFIWKR